MGVIPDKKSPTFDYTCVIKSIKEPLENAVIKFLVYDHDTMTSDDDIGCHTMDLGTSKLDGEYNWCDITSPKGKPAGQLLISVRKGLVARTNEVRCKWCREPFVV